MDGQKAAMRAGKREETMTASPAWLRAAAFAIVLATAPALAQSPQNPVADARIVVTGEGHVSVAPDYAAISAGVVSRARTAGEAAEANAKSMAAVINALTDSGIARNDIQTLQYSLAPVYAAPQPGSEQKLTGFSVSNRLNVKIRDIGKAGAVLDKLVAAGATDIGNVEYQHSNSSALLDQARQAAMADARRKAELYAKAADLALGVVAFVSEDAGSAAPVFGKMMRAAASPMPTQILNGEDTLSVQVIVGFDILH
jgi:uncharacterized protein YggE